MMADHGHGTDKAHGAGHEHGTMKTDAQEKTFAGFIRLTTWGVCIAIGVLIFMALVNS